MTAMETKPSTHGGMVLKIEITGSSKLHVFHCSSLNALPTTSGHTPDDLADGVLEDLLPDLHQGINEIVSQNSLPCS